MYKGEAKNGLPEGRGVYNDPNDTVYDGEFILYIYFMKNIK